MNSDDVVVIGGGLAGTAAATALAERGVGVTLLEKERFPRDKLCGEFLSPEAQQMLADLGVLDEVLAARPARINLARFTTSSGRVLEIKLQGTALGLSRRRLDALLFARAGRAGARTFSNAEVRRIGGPDGSARRAIEVDLRDSQESRALTLDARVVVAAYGRRASLDRALGRAFVQKRHPYVGLKQHHRPAPGAAGDRLRSALNGAVEVHTVDGGYCGICFVEEDTVNVCALLERRFGERSGGFEWKSVAAQLCAENAILRSRLDSLIPTDSPTLAVAEIPFGSKERDGVGLFFIGDAAGVVAPLVGDGQAMALSTGLLVADTIARAQGRPIAPKAWDRAWRLRFGMRMFLGQRLQDLLLKPAAADIAVRLVNHAPAVAGLLLRLTRG